MAGRRNVDELSYNIQWDRDGLTSLAPLPAYEEDATAAPERRSQVRERCHGIREEHHPELRNHKLESMLWESVGLSIDILKACVSQTGRAS